MDPNKGMFWLIRYLYHFCYSQIYTDYMLQITADYTAAVGELKIRIPQEIDELMKSANIMTEDLVEYIENNDMNQAFFM